MRKSLTLSVTYAVVLMAGAALAAQQPAPAAREPVLGHGPSERNGVREAGKAPALANPEPDMSYSYGYPLLPHAISVAAAKAAMDACAARGAYVAVTVIDTYGIERVTFVHERSRPLFELDKARRKAMTAMNDRGNLSSDMAVAYSEREGGIPYQLVASPANIGLPGGAPLKIKGNYLVAGLGVSGASDPRIDEQCAIDGIKQVQAKLDQVKHN